MRQQIEQKLQALRGEAVIGQRTLVQLEQQMRATETTLLRISGAIQVLEEMLAADAPAAPAGQSEEQSEESAGSNLPAAN